MNLVKTLGSDKMQDSCDCDWSCDTEGPYLELRCQLCDTIDGEEERASKKPWLVVNRKLKAFWMDIGHKLSEERLVCIERMCTYIQVISPLTAKVPHIMSFISEAINEWKDDPEYASIRDLLVATARITTV